MALQTSGAISLSQIAAHFGGSGSHSLSEYHALAGKGVSGIPSSGSISFSHFHGKSNQVTTSVWVSSGYNSSSSSWAEMTDGSRYAAYQGHYRYRIYPISRYYNEVYASQITHAGITYRAGSYYAQKLTVTTTWVDTSGYQNTTTTAQITT